MTKGKTKGFLQPQAVKRLLKIQLLILSSLQNSVEVQAN